MEVLPRYLGGRLFSRVSSEQLTRKRKQMRHVHDVGLEEESTVIWPPIFPDLRSLDIFAFGNTKSIVYQLKLILQL